MASNGVRSSHAISITRDTSLSVSPVTAGTDAASIEEFSWLLLLAMGIPYAL